MTAVLSRARVLVVILCFAALAVLAAPLAVSSTASVSNPDVTVYRTHGPDETADILATGRYRLLPGAMETKNFFETERQARELAARFESVGIKGPHSISTARLPRAVYDRPYLVSIGGGGEALIVGVNDVPLVYDVRIIGPAK